jgi:hypothetical protein
MSQVSVCGGSKMKEKPPRPLAFEQLTAQAESLLVFFFFKKCLPLQNLLALT